MSLEGAVVKTGEFVAHLNGRTSASQTHVAFMVRGESVRTVLSAPTVRDGPSTRKEAIYDKQVNCNNSSYAFVAGRKASSGDWVTLGLGGPPTGQPVERAEAAREWAGFVWAAWFIEPVALNELVDKPGFTLDRLEQTENSGVPQAKADFTYTPSDDDVAQQRTPGSLPTLRGGTMWLAPNEHWSLTKCDLRLQDGTESIVVEYGERLSGFLMPKRVTRTTNTSRWSNVVSADVKDLVSRDVGELEFTLSAFGLPEPLGPAKPMRWWLWGSLAGGALLVMAAVFDWLRRRAKR